MIKKLPKWVEYCTFFLAVLAGSINAVGLISFDHQAVSHVSGTVSQLGVSLFLNINATPHLVIILLSFIVGAIISGVLIRNEALQLGRRYGYALLMEALLLYIALYLLNNDSFSGHYFASMACGLQNALFTTFSGAILRTTHLTGIFTDLGLMIGQYIRGKEFDKRKSILFMLIVFGFLLGSTIGAWLFTLFFYNALLFPILLSLLLAFVYWLYSYRHKSFT